MNDLSHGPGCLLAEEWPAAAGMVWPVLLPASRTAEGARSAPLVTGGPAGLAVAYVVGEHGSEMPVNVDHLRVWEVEPEEIHAAAMANLAAWSESAAWTDEVNGCRRLVWSDSEEGPDAARILLDNVRRRLVRELGSEGRVLVGMPERHLLVATGAAPADRELEAMFADYVAGRAKAADEPIDARVFELVDGELVESEITVRA